MEKIVILGLTTCSRCKNLLAVLLQKDINFSYFNLDDYPKENKEEVLRYKKFIQEHRLTDLPILLLIKDSEITITDAKHILQ